MYLSTTLDGGEAPLLVLKFYYIRRRGGPAARRGSGASSTTLDEFLKLKVTEK